MEEHGNQTGGRLHKNRGVRMVYSLRTSVFGSPACAWLHDKESPFVTQNERLGVELILPACLRSISRCQLFQSLSWNL